VEALAAVRTSGDRFVLASILDSEDPGPRSLLITH
jgi:hypothetical protein